MKIWNCKIFNEIKSHSITNKIFCGWYILLLWYCCFDIVDVMLLMCSCCCGIVDVMLLMGCCWCDVVDVMLLLWYCCCWCSLCNEYFYDFFTLLMTLNDLIFAIWENFYKAFKNSYFCYVEDAKETCWLIIEI